MRRGHLVPRSSEVGAGLPSYRWYALNKATRLPGGLASSLTDLSDQILAETPFPCNPSKKYIKGEGARPMAQAMFDRQEPSFGFTDEDHTRRYSPQKSPVTPAPIAPAAPPAQRTRLHGSGNSFMRARRRRLAASAST